MAVDIGLEQETREAIPIDFFDAGDWESQCGGIARANARLRAGLRLRG